jgi:hypothetical protein
MNGFTVVGFIVVGIVVVGMMVWTFFIASPLWVRSREKNPDSRVPFHARIGAVKRINRLDKPVSELKSPE